MAGDGVALASRGSWLLIVTKLPGRRSDDAPLEFRLVDVEGRSEWASGPLPLTPGARLRWVGISEDYAVMTLDTSGGVRALLAQGHNALPSFEWVPVQNLQEEERASSASLWAVAAAPGALRCATLPTGDEAELEPAERMVAGVDQELQRVGLKLPPSLFWRGGSAEVALGARLLEGHRAAMEGTSGVDASTAQLPPELSCAGQAAFRALSTLAWEAKECERVDDKENAQASRYRCLELARRFMNTRGDREEWLTKAADFCYKPKVGEYELGDKLVELRTGQPVPLEPEDLESTVQAANDDGGTLVEIDVDDPASDQPLAKLARLL